MGQFLIRVGRIIGFSLSRCLGKKRQRVTAAEREAFHVVFFSASSDLFIILVTEQSVSSLLFLFPVPLGLGLSHSSSD